MTITRIINNNELLEIFTIPKKYELYYNTKRQMYYTIWLLTNKYALHPILKLKNIIYSHTKTIYVYEYENKPELQNIPHIETISFSYEPILGKKKCQKCYYYYHSKNSKNICVYKGIKIKKFSWYKCLYWKEKSLHTLKDITNGALLNGK